MQEDKTITSQIKFETDESEVSSAGQLAIRLRKTLQKKTEDLQNATAKVENRLDYVHTCVQIVTEIDDHVTAFYVDALELFDECIAQASAQWKASARKLSDAVNSLEESKVTTMMHTCVYKAEEYNVSVFLRLA